MEVEVRGAEICRDAEEGIAERDRGDELFDFQQDVLGEGGECGAEGLEVSGRDGGCCGEDFGDVGAGVAGEGEGAEEFEVEGFVGGEGDWEHGFRILRLNFEG